MMLNYLIKNQTKEFEGRNLLIRCKLYMYVLNAEWLFGNII